MCFVVRVKVTAHADIKRLAYQYRRADRYREAAKKLESVNYKGPSLAQNLAAELGPVWRCGPVEAMSHLLELPATLLRSEVLDARLTQVIIYSPYIPIGSVQ